MPLWLLTRLPFLGKVPWKLVGIGVAVLAISILAWRIAAWRTGYLKLGEAQHALEQETKGRLKDREDYLANMAQAEKDAQALAHDLGEIRTRFSQLAPVVPKTLIRTVEVPRDPAKETCPDTRLSPEFRLRWNAAATP